jgi:hypothetical protein
MAIFLADHTMNGDLDMDGPEPAGACSKIVFSAHHRFWTGSCDPCRRSQYHPIEKSLGVKLVEPS